MLLDERRRADNLWRQIVAMQRRLDVKQGSMTAQKPSSKWTSHAYISTEEPSDISAKVMPEVEPVQTRPDAQYLQPLAHTASQIWIGSTARLTVLTDSLLRIQRKRESAVWLESACVQPLR
eukprot:1062331-Pleurochrysis_carterae.AAC.1